MLNFLNLCFLYILKCSFICVTSHGSFSVLNLNEPHLYPCVSSFLVNSYASITLWLHPDVLYVFIETNIGTVFPPWPHPLLAFLQHTFTFIPIVSAVSLQEFADICESLFWDKSLYWDGDYCILSLIRSKGFVKN